MNLDSMSLADLEALRDTLDAVESLMVKTGATLDLTADAPKIALSVFPAQKALLPDSFALEVGDYFPLADAPAADVIAEPEPVQVEPQPETPAPQPVAAPPAKMIGASWSSEEDDLLVAVRIELRDKSVYGCAHEVVRRLAEIGSVRTPDAVAVRINKTLRARIDAALAEVVAPDEPEPVAAAPVEPEPPVDVGIPMSVAGVAFRAPITDGLPIWQRHIRAALNGLGYVCGWSPDEDLRLVEMIGQGWKLGTAAEALDRDHASVNARWQALAAIARDGKDRLTLDDQAHLVAELRARAVMAAGE